MGDRRECVSLRVMAQPNKTLQGVLLVILILGGLAALVATFFLAGEDHLPGSFYIDRQAMWGDGRYYVKFTFLMTLLTLADVVAVPLILFAGLRAMLPVVLFDALLAPQYVEGQIEALQIVVNKSTRTAQLQVAGVTHEVSGELADGLAQGMTVGLIVSGFLDSVLRLEKRR